MKCSQERVCQFRYVTESDSLRLFSDSNKLPSKFDLDFSKKTRFKVEEFRLE